MGMMPVISVVIPTYNRQDLTLRAISSVHTSYPEAVEIVVIDDAGSEAFHIESMKNQSGVVVRVIRLGINSGPGVARFEGVKVAIGKIIAFLDSDDEFLEGWVDSLFELSRGRNLSLGSGAMIVGIAENPQLLNGFVSRALKAMPPKMRLGLARLSAVFFNPFYTPSIAITRGNIRFHDHLRHCEDYFMTAVALFQVDQLILLDVGACRLGRPPNTMGGETSHIGLMCKGEMDARRALRQEPLIPLWFKVLYPLGRTYQALRTAIKVLRRLNLDNR